jgi:hypothetical protein
MLGPARNLRGCSIYLGIHRRRSMVRLTGDAADDRKTMWTLLSYLYLDVLQLGALESGLRLSTVLFSGLAAAVSLIWYNQS